MPRPSRCLPANFCKSAQPPPPDVPAETSERFSAAAAGERAGIIRGLNDCTPSAALFDPTLECAVLYFRLAANADAEGHRGLAEDRLKRIGSNVLASGEAPYWLFEPRAYCLLAEVPDEGMSAILDAVREIDNEWMKSLESRMRLQT